MRVYRGRADEDHDRDHEATSAMLAATAETDEPGLRVWRPGPVLAFGRRDRRADGYERARETAADRGFPPAGRSVGGRAVAYADSTLAVAYAAPTPDPRSGIDDRYEWATDRVATALADLGCGIERGEPADAFCPGDHSLRVTGGGKVAGIAQRVRRGAALVAAVVIVDADDEIAAVLDSVYAALGVPFDPGSVGSVATAGGPDDPETVARAIEDAMATDPTVEPAWALLDGV
ncbi:lipoate--protein ligase [Halobacteriales archaeon SW_7_68_16]|nr:MAG: lipoate--protein ligase [Halobacteriales archaeon SW_7_68_16]